LSRFAAVLGGLAAALVAPAAGRGETAPAAAPVPCRKVPDLEDAWACPRGTTCSEAKVCVADPLVRPPTAARAGPPPFIDLGARVSFGASWPGPGELDHDPAAIPTFAAAGYASPTRYVSIGIEISFSSSSYPTDHLPPIDPLVGSYGDRLSLDLPRIGPVLRGQLSLGPFAPFAEAAPALAVGEMSVPVNLLFVPLADTSKKETATGFMLRAALGLELSLDRSWGLFGEVGELWANTLDFGELGQVNVGGPIALLGVRWRMPWPSRAADLSRAPPPPSPAR
jgi:hypothetical protein